MRGAGFGGGMWGSVVGEWLGLGFWGWNWGVFTELGFKLFPCLICGLGRVVVGCCGGHCCWSCGGWCLLVFVGGVTVILVILFVWL